MRVAEACKAAADARADGADLEHMLAWLTGAHAQEMALHQAFQSEVGWTRGTAWSRLPHTCWLSCDPDLPSFARSVQAFAGSCRMVRREGGCATAAWPLCPLCFSWLPTSDASAWHVVGRRRGRTAEADTRCLPRPRS